MDRWNDTDLRITPIARPRARLWGLVKIGAALAAMLIALTSITVGYAVFNNWGDPGLKSVEQAGLVTPVEITAEVESYITPTVPAIASIPPVESTAMPYAVAQSGEVTAAIESVYADAQRIALVYTIYNLPDEVVTQLTEFAPPEPGAQTADFYDLWMGLSYVDGSLFNSSTGGGPAPGPEPGSLRVRATFEHNEPIPVDGTFDLMLNVTMTHSVSVADGNGGFSGSGQQETLYEFRFNLALNVISATEIPVNQTQSANSITFTLQSVSVTPAGTSLTLCYDLPPGIYDWWPVIILTIDGEEGQPIGGRDLAGKTDVSDATQRCVQHDFSTPYTPDTKQIIVTVDRLQASISEVLAEATIQRAKERLAAQGIEAEITNGNHGIQYEVIHSPEGMPDNEVGKAIWDALAEQHPGPWVFTVDLP